jgi:hypothetical protein
MRHLTWPAKTEPSIHEVLSDPIVRQLMTRDNVCDDDLIDLIESVRHKLAVRVWRSNGARFRKAPLRELSADPGSPRRR